MGINYVGSRKNGVNKAREQGASIIEYRDLVKLY